MAGRKAFQTGCSCACGPQATGPLWPQAPNLKRTSAALALLWLLQTGFRIERRCFSLAKPDRTLPYLIVGQYRTLPVTAAGPSSTDLLTAAAEAATAAEAGPQVQAGSRGLSPTGRRAGPSSSSETERSGKRSRITSGRMVRIA